MICDSLSGLTIDHVAHEAGGLGLPRVAFDMTDAPVRSMRAHGCFEPGTAAAPRDVFVQGPLDESVLALVDGLGWLDQLTVEDTLLAHLCLASLRTLEAFVAAKAGGGGAVDAAAIERVRAAIAAEVEREKQFYGDE